MVLISLKAFCLLLEAANYSAPEVDLIPDQQTKTLTVRLHSPAKFTNRSSVTSAKKEHPQKLLLPSLTLGSFTRSLAHANSTCRCSRCGPKQTLRTGKLTRPDQAEIRNQ